MFVREGNVKYDVFISYILEYVVSKYNYVLFLMYCNMYVFSIVEIDVGERVVFFFKMK